MQRQFRSDDTPRKWTHKYGNGNAGDKVVSSNETYDGAVAGLIGNYVVEPDITPNPIIEIDDASTFENGDLVLIHETRDTDPLNAAAVGISGKWELNKIRSGQGTLNLTLEYPLMNAYLNDSPTGSAPFDFTKHAQIVEMKQYKNLTIDATFSFVPVGWDGNKGGIMAFYVKDTLTINGDLNAIAKGFRGGTRNDVSGNTGESRNGYWQHQQPFQNGGGGGQKAESGAGGGAGGGNATAGANGVTINSGAGGTGGLVAGQSDLVVMVFGGGGGMGGDGWAGGTNGPGGKGGGIIIIIAKKVVVNNTTGTIRAHGEAGGNGSSGGGQKAAAGGGGAGGNILIKCQQAILGTSRVQAPGGSGGANLNGDQGSGGQGGDGRIHIDYAKSLTGTTTPTADTRIDKTLYALRPAAALLRMLK